jgi:choline kinase
MNNLTCIIPAAGPGRRMKSYGPKALITLRNEQTVIQRQLQIINRLYPAAEVIVVLGFEADRVKKELPPHVKVVENHIYEETNVAYSIHLGLLAATHKNVLIVYGDLVFNDATLKGLTFAESTAIIDSKERFEKSEVGVTIVDGYISRMSYGLPMKWAQIVYLTGHELHLFKMQIHMRTSRKFFGFEVLNKMLDYSGYLKAIEPEKMQIAEIDTSKDIEKAKKIE